MEKLKLDETNSPLLTSNLTSPKTIIEIPTKPYVDTLHESNRNRRDVSSVYNDHGKEFNNNKILNFQALWFFEILIQIMS